MFSLFQPNPNSHLRRAMALLQEANLARIEHQAAAEHHGALARMYTERARRLEREVYDLTHVPPPADTGVTDAIGLDDKPMLYALNAGRHAEAKA